MNIYQITLNTDSNIGISHEIEFWWLYYNSV